MRNLLWLALAIFGVNILTGADTDKVTFNRDIRPIMSDTCFRCHGPDKGSRLAGLRLDIRDEALKPTRSGKIPIVPGDPDKSEIIERIFATDAKIMPPKFAHRELTAKQKDTIRRWVAQGAVYEGHWAYQPIQRPTVPPATNAALIRNPIDNFIQERLNREGLSPAQEADKRTLIRRVMLDLTGLPPSSDQVHEFLSDKSPDAYEKLVDTLLQSQRFAEQQTMHWLDAVRYADTCGFHGDNPIPIWPYRDYILRAFLNNKPFDQFTREQIAGDLLPNASLEQRVAAAYNRLNRTSAEGGLQPKEYLAKYGADRVRTLSAVWLGSTMGCAECHDHKFDPFLTKDFYAMKAFFADVKETGLVPDRGPKAWGEQLSLPSEEQQRQRSDLDAKLTVARAKPGRENHCAEGPTGTVGARTQTALGGRRNSRGPGSGRLPHSALHGAQLTIYGDQPVDSTYYVDGSLKSDRKAGNGLVVASGPNPDDETYLVTLQPGEGSWNELGIDVVQDDSLPGARYARGADRFLLSEIEVQIVEEGAPGRKLSLTHGNRERSPAQRRIHHHRSKHAATGRYRWRPADCVGNSFRRGARSFSGCALQRTC